MNKIFLKLIQFLIIVLIIYKICKFLFHKNQLGINSKPSKLQNIAELNKNKSEQKFVF